ncbi:MAG: hypothetical protein R3B54_04980 [Bdellovibrionota bacterium]
MKDDDIHVQRRSDLLHFSNVPPTHATQVIVSSHVNKHRYFFEATGSIESLVKEVYSELTL